MNHFPNGKISRLPHHIREQISLRLRDSHSAVQILAWLNSSAEVKQVLSTMFAGRPITKNNLSQWKKRSHRQWLLEQAALSDTDRLLIQSRQLAQAGEGAITDHLATYIAAQYALARTQLGDPTDPQTSLKLLRALCDDVVRLRRGDHLAQSLTLQRQRQEFRRPSSPMIPITPINPILKTSKMSCFLGADVDDRTISEAQSPVFVCSQTQIKENQTK